MNYFGDVEKNLYNLSHEVLFWKVLSVVKLDVLSLRMSHINQQMCYKIVFTTQKAGVGLKQINLLRN